MVAKYFASGAAARASTQAVQVLGAIGTSPRYPVERHFRDAKIMQIIEGSDQMQQLTIAEHALRGRAGVDE
jgi:alkylation response protein AidB-like acyl-CoA dehydrogenase